MHWIQTHILEQLSLIAERRNRDLRPDSVESNLFQYHLNRLVQEGYVKKEGVHYTLAPLGLSWADRYSTQLKGARPQPKVVTILAIHNQQGEYLLIPKALQPYVGDYYLPSGKIRLGERLEQAAQREAYEKLGFEQLSLQSRGTVRVCIAEEHMIVTDYIGFVFSAALPKGCKVPLSGLWYRLDNMNNVSVMPGTAQILSCLSNNNAPRDVVITKP